MRVKLLKDIKQGNVLKVSQRGTRPAVPFVKDAIIEMSDASGKKYVDAGNAVEVKDDAVAK